MGMRGNDIAAFLGMSPSRVSIVKNSILGKHKLEDLCERADEEAIDVMGRIREMAPKALEVLNGLLEDTMLDARVQKDVAFGLLDRAGFSAVHKNVNVNAPVTPEYIEELKKRAQQEGMVVTSETPQDDEP